MDKILVSGATGFIGSNIAKKLLEEGYIVYATHRNSSSFEKCGAFKNRIEWINTDCSGWKEKIEKAHPDQFIHTAWSGVEADRRNSWDLQLTNFWLSKEYIDLAISCNIKKIIALGSQAEYGRYDIPVNENTFPRPEDAYGAVKILVSNYLRNICENYGKEWYWIRVFSVFGENEDKNWLIPTVISGLIRQKPIPLTSCEQQFNYLYIGDFLSSISAILQSDADKSGIYNICNSDSIRLRDLLLEIAGLMNASPELLQFGVLPYRTGQNMKMIGDNSKFMGQFHYSTDFVGELKIGLKKTITYYQEKLA